MIRDLNRSRNKKTKLSYRNVISSLIIYRSLPVASLPSIISLIFLTRKPGKRRKIFSLADCVCYDEIRGQFAAIALKHARPSNGISRNTRPARYSSSRRPHRRQSYGFVGAAIVSKHHTHASVNIFARTHVCAAACFRR